MSVSLAPIITQPNLKGTRTMGITITCPHCFTSSDEHKCSFQIRHGGRGTHLCKFQCIDCGKDFEVEIYPRKEIGEELAKSVKYFEVLEDSRQKTWEDFLDSIKDLSDEERADDVRRYFTSTDSPDDFWDEKNPSIYDDYIKRENERVEAIGKKWDEFQASIKHLSPEERFDEERRFRQLLRP